jgi:adenine-specific DNA methylase
MLKNGLGQLLKREIIDAKRFVDIFVGSGSVAIHVAENYNIPVQAFDLQYYSTIITSAIISRQDTIEWLSAWNAWYHQAKRLYGKHDIPSMVKVTQDVVKNCRSWCVKQDALQITKAYGGHYFSPKQSVWIDALRSSLPKDESIKIVALSALIQAASQCAAAPGHTAQPFQPTRTAKQFLVGAWEKDIVQFTKNIFISLCTRFANKQGISEVADANNAAKQLKEGDLVFIDPPYSGVHYSRFYHVLETIAKGECGEVSGVGRYPDPSFRPRSKYSVQSESVAALDDLLGTVARNKAKAILTFPDHECSNGLSGTELYPKNWTAILGGKNGYISP